MNSLTLLLHNFFGFHFLGFVEYRPPTSISRLSESEQRGEIDFPRSCAKLFQIYEWKGIHYPFR